MITLFNGVIPAALLELDYLEKPLAYRFYIPAYYNSV